MTGLGSQEIPFVKLVLAAAILLILGLVLVPGEPSQAQAIPWPLQIRSQIICAPATHPSCFPGPYTTVFQLDEPAAIAIDVYLVHTGNYEDNEQSAFSSPLGEISNCGPIPAGTEEIFCGRVSGFTEGDVPLTIHHTGTGSSTGSHQQRYEIKLCKYKTFFPIIIR